MYWCDDDDGDASDTYTPVTISPSSGPTSDQASLSATTPGTASSTPAIGPTHSRWDR